MTVSVSACPLPILAITGNNGEPLANGSILTQVASVNYPTYQDSAGTIALQNPIPLNSRGEVSDASGNSQQLFLVNGIIYQFTYFDGPNGTGNQIGDPQYVTGQGATATSIGTVLYPILAAEGSTVVNIQYPYGDIRRYGADPAGILDSTAAIQAAANIGFAVFSVDGTYLLNSSGITTSSQKQDWYWDNAYWQVGSSFSGTTVLTIGSNAGAGSGSRIHHPFIDGGFSQTGSGASTVGTPYATNLISILGGSIIVYDPYLTHFSGYGLGFVSTYSGDSWCYNPFITQWNNGDGPWANPANFTGDCIYFNRADCWLNGGETRWAKNCLHFGPSSATSQVTNHHPYNGVYPWAGNPSAVASIDPIMIQIDFGANNVNIHDCYLDSGHIEIHAMNTSIRDCYFLQNGAACLFSADASGFPTFIRVYNDAARIFPYDLDINTHNWYPALTNAPTSSLATRFVTFLPGAPVAITGASGNGTTATVTFAALTYAPTVGSVVTITGMNPSGYNIANALVTASSITSISYACTTSSAFVAGGTLSYQWTGDISVLSGQFSQGMEFSSASTRVDLVGNGSNLEYRNVISPDTYIEQSIIPSQGQGAGPATAIKLGYGFNAGTGNFAQVIAGFLGLQGVNNPASTYVVTGASGDGVHVTLTFGSSTAPVVGSSWTVTGINPAGYNGTYVVTASSTTSVTYASAFAGAYVSGGNVSCAIVYAITGASGDGTHVTLTFATNTVPVVGSTWIVSGMTPTGYNGTVVVTSSSSTTLLFASAFSTAFVSGGTAVLSPTASLSFNSYEVTVREDGAGNMQFLTNNTVRATIFADGGMVMAGATGGSKGAGTINVTNIYQNGTAYTNP